MKISNAVALLTLAACATSCAFLESLFPGSSAVAGDPEVQAAAGGVVRNIILGNWVGAAGAFGELLFTALGVYKATMMRRDSLRKKRKEPTGKKPPEPMADIDVTALLRLLHEKSAPPAEPPPGV